MEIGKESKVDQQLNGKVVLIAGGSSGMGLALGKKAASLGAEVHIVGRSSARLAAAVGAIGHGVVAHRADIGVESDVRAMADKLSAVDHLVTTAASLTFKPFAQIDDSDIERSLRSKLWGPVYLVRHLAPKLAKDGSITFYSGIAAYKATWGLSITAAVNVALDGLNARMGLLALDSSAGHGGSRSLDHGVDFGTALHHHQAKMERRRAVSDLDRGRSGAIRVHGIGEGTRAPLDGGWHAVAHDVVHLGPVSQSIERGHGNPAERPRLGSGQELAFDGEPVFPSKGPIRAPPLPRTLIGDGASACAST
jgi:short chain dehydrogenase